MLKNFIATYSSIVYPGQSKDKCCEGGGADKLKETWESPLLLKLFTSPLNTENFIPNIKYFNLVVMYSVYFKL